MPRTLPAALTTVMDAGIYEPYLRVVINDDPLDDGLQVTVQPLAFRLEALRATVKVAWTSNPASFFRIVRGALINGTPSTISSIWFKVVEYKYDGKFLDLIGEPLDRVYATVAINSTYQTVIEAALLRSGADPFIASYEGAAAWKAYQFYPTGRTIVLSPKKRLFTLLQQKYLVWAAEDGWDGTNNNIYFFQPTIARATDYTIADPIFNYNIRQEFRKIIARDEASVIRSDGLSTSVIHNLGFLHSTASLPTNATVQQVGSHTRKIPVHLKYRTGDKVDFTLDSNINPLAMRVNVIEVLDLEATPAWYMILSTLEWFGTTEGGAMPSTIEAAAPYTPLITGNFDGILSENDNNLQAAMETIDDHTHAAAYTDERIQDLVGAMVASNVETNITVTYDDTNGKLDFAVTGGAADGWTAGTGTWSYTSADSPTFVASIPDADAAAMNVGDRLKLTQTTVKYFIVTAKGSPSAGFTPVTIYGGTDYTLANAAITLPYYSHAKSPLGFPTSPAKWTVTFTDTTERSQAAPTQNTWYNLGSLSLSIPIGVWRVNFKRATFVNRTVAGSLGIDSSLSSSASSASDSELTDSISNGLLTSIAGFAFTSKLITLAAKTTYYPIARTIYASMLNLYFENQTAAMLVEAVCAYL